MKPEQYRLMRLRYEALAQDWHRLRDQDAEWRHFQRIVTRAVVVLAALFVLGALTGCDSPGRRCDRWTAAVEGHELCAASPRCRSEIDRLDYIHYSEAKIAQAQWCPKEKL